MKKIMNEEEILPGEGVIHQTEGVDLIPANIELSGLEVSLVNAMSRETIMKQYIDMQKSQGKAYQYDYACKNM